MSLPLGPGLLLAFLLQSAEQDLSSGQLFDVGGHRLYIRCFGKGPTPTVILDHGYAGHSGTWDGLAERVAEFARVCTYDRAGWGESEPGPYPRDGDSKRYVKELRTLLKEAGVEPPYLLVGHSRGVIVQWGRGPLPTPAHFAGVLPYYRAAGKSHGDIP